MWLVSMFSGVSTRLATMGAALAGLLAAFLLIRKSGADAQKTKQMKETLNHVEIRNAVERDIERDGDVVERLRSKWTRK